MLDRQPQLKVAQHEQQAAPAMQMEKLLVRWEYSTSTKCTVVAGCISEAHVNIANTPSSKKCMQVPGANKLWVPSLLCSSVRGQKATTAPLRHCAGRKACSSRGGRHAPLLPAAARSGQVRGGPAG